MTNRGPEFAYIDESGDIGVGGSTTYTLGCLLIPMAEWTDALDHMVTLRRELKKTYRVLQSQEVKANHLVGVKKVYSDLGLGDGQVRDIYRRHMDSVSQISSGTCAVVIHKSKINKSDIDVFGTAWEYMFTRLRKRSESSGNPIMVVHDDGERVAVRKALRKFRRNNWQGSRYGEARLLIEDSVARDSQQSYFIQLADLVAYAASRNAVPANGKTTKVCDTSMWERLGDVRIPEVSGRRDGIYKWP